MGGSFVPPSCLRGCGSGGTEPTVSPAQGQTATAPFGVGRERGSAIIASKPRRSAGLLVRFGRQMRSGSPCSSCQHDFERVAEDAVRATFRTLCSSIGVRSFCCDQRHENSAFGGPRKRPSKKPFVPLFHRKKPCARTKSKTWPRSIAPKRSICCQESRVAQSCRSFPRSCEEHQPKTGKKLGRNAP